MFESNAVRVKCKTSNYVIFQTFTFLKSRFVLCVQVCDSRYSHDDFYIREVGTGTLGSKDISLVFKSATYTHCLEVITSDFFTETLPNFSIMSF